FNAALVEFDAIPADLGSQILKQFESLGPFTTEKQRQELKDALVLKELGRMIEAVPEIEQASVAVANSGRRSTFQQRGRVTANVTVKARSGREISNRLVNALRHAVASMVPDLAPSDVTVFDVVRGISFVGETDEDSHDSRLIQRIREFTLQYEKQIQKALGYIPRVGVAVHVDIEHVKSSVTKIERTRVHNDLPPPVANRPSSIIQASATSSGNVFRGFDDLDRNTVGFQRETSADNPVDAQSSTGNIVKSHEVSEKELLAAMPRAVQVSVSIPREYYQEVAARRQKLGEKNPARLDPSSIEEEVIAKVEKTIARLIPADSPRESVSVTTIDSVEVQLPPNTLTGSEEALVVVQRNAGPFVLVAVAIWAVWMLMKLSRPVSDRQKESFREPSSM
ncbi:MAG: hypothetical protein FJ267_17130, partial [Planctomycetes bacterium]|nr:hypothetical protein [Planctomycetota bacterium]